MPRSLKRVFVVYDRVTATRFSSEFAEIHSTSAAEGTIAKARKLGRLMQHQTRTS